jgi:hypothetical protein
MFIIMFNLRHIQLIVLLTSKDENNGEKFHRPQHLLEKVSQPPSGSAQKARIYRFFDENSHLMGGPYWLGMRQGSAVWAGNMSLLKLSR